jgi:hypothetical protein
LKTPGREQYYEYDVDYWQNVNICTPLTKLSLKHDCDCILPTSIQAPNLTSLTVDPSYENNFSFEQINSFLHLKYLNFNKNMTIAVPLDENGQLDQDRQQQFNLFLSNLPLMLLSFNGVYSLQDQQIQMILQ